MYQLKIKVYYEDTDSGGVVYYANYLKFIERARTNLIQELGFSLSSLSEKYDCHFVVKNIECNYAQSAKLEDELTIRSFVKSITKTSFFMNQVITKDDHIIVEAKIHLVFVNGDGKPVRIPEEIYSKFKPYFCDTIKS